MSDYPLRIDKEGRWFYGPEEITHRRTYLLFSQNLVRDVAGRFAVRIGQEECPVEVEDAPFVVQTLTSVLGENGEINAIFLTLNDETQEILEPLTLRIGAGNIPYCRVRSGMFEARFSHAAYELLAPLFRHDDKDDLFYIQIAGRKFQLHLPN